MERTVTTRGFRVVRFFDRYNFPCSLQESSLATEHAVWLGIDTENDPSNRMHLTLEQVEMLLPYLQHFVQSGRIGEW